MFVLRLGCGLILQCHPEGTELHKAQSFSSIKLGNYTDADVMTVGEICTTASHVLRGKHIWGATSCHRARGRGQRQEERWELHLSESHQTSLKQHSLSPSVP